MVLRHPQTPRLAKFFLWLAIGYLMLPFDLVPDFIPVLGQLDDMLVVPGLIYLALKVVPEEIVAQCRSESRRMNTKVNNDKEKKWKS